MRLITVPLIGLGVLLSLSGSPLVAQNCAMQCPGACLRNTMGSAETPSGHALGSRSPAEVLASNKALSSKLQSLLPQGMDVKEAASGFKKLDQFIAAVHASQNLRIPFSALKGKLVGKGKESLSKAIQELSPDVNARAELKKVNQQTSTDLDSTSKVTVT